MSTEFPKPPMSAARLAAEAAFAAPAQPAPPPVAPAQVTLRRSRLGAGPDEAAGAPRQASGAAPAAEAGPRVFRVVAALPVLPAAPVPLSPGLEAESAPVAVPRTRRVRAERRPSAVVVVKAAEPPARQAAATSELPPLQPEALRAELQRAGALLEMAAQAQSFRIDSTAFDSDWERLSRRAEQLLKELRAQLG
jgi:hypothetical protein